MTIEGSSVFSFSLMRWRRSCSPLGAADRPELASGDDCAETGVGIDAHQIPARNRDESNRVRGGTGTASGERAAALGGGNRVLALAGGAAVAVQGSPRNSAVVALAAILALDDFDHGDLIGPGFHDKDVVVANLALEPDAVKPVREDHRRHFGLLGLAVHHDVAVLRADLAD